MRVKKIKHPSCEVFRNRNDFTIDRKGTCFSLERNGHRLTLTSTLYKSVYTIRIGVGFSKFCVLLQRQLGPSNIPCTTIENVTSDTSLFALLTVEGCNILRIISGLSGRLVFLLCQINCIVTRNRISTMVLTGPCTIRVCYHGLIGSFGIRSSSTFVRTIERDGTLTVFG